MDSFCQSFRVENFNVSFQGSVSIVTFLCSAEQNKTKVSGKGFLYFLLFRFFNKFFFLHFVTLHFVGICVVFFIRLLLCDNFIFIQIICVIIIFHKCIHVLILRRLEEIYIVLFHLRKFKIYLFISFLLFSIFFHFDRFLQYLESFLGKVSTVSFLRSGHKRAKVT